jgi:hypothetical protein
MQNGQWTTGMEKQTVDIAMLLWLSSVSIKVNRTTKSVQYTFISMGEKQQEEMEQEQLKGWEEEDENEIHNKR